MVNYNNMVNPMFSKFDQVLGKTTPTPTTTAQAPVTSRADEIRALANANLQPEKRDLLSKASGALNMVFPSKNIGDVIGTGIAKSKDTSVQDDAKYLDILHTLRDKAAKENNQDREDYYQEKIDKFKPTEEYVKKDESTTGLSVLGDVAQNAAYFLPVGKAASAGSKVLSKVLPKTAAKVAGNVAAGAGTGYAFDVAANLSEGKTGAEAMKPGMATGIGTALPLAGPTIRGASRLAGEALGATTGTGYGVIKKGLEASAKGGKEAEAFRGALRGNTAPDEIVTEARSALSSIISERNKAYSQKLQELTKDISEHDITPLISKYDELLSNYGVSLSEKGALDFTRSPGLGRYAKDVDAIKTVLEDWGSKEGDFTTVGIDKLKQTLDDFRIGSADSKKFDSMVTALRNSAKDIIKDVPGYSSMTGEYSRTTGLINEIQRGLSIGDKVQADTAFRKLSSVMRTNNEFRQQLIQELDQATGGTLLPKIAGQQLSELLPRGLMKPLGALGGVGAAGAGVGILPILKAAIFTSPRAVGEMINAMGFVGEKGTKLIDAISKYTGKLQAPGDYLIDKINDTPNKKGGFIKNPFATKIPKSTVNTKRLAGETEAQYLDRLAKEQSVDPLTAYKDNLPSGVPTTEYNKTPATKVATSVGQYKKEIDKLVSEMSKTNTRASKLYPEEVKKSIANELEDFLENQSNGGPGLTADDFFKKKYKEFGLKAEGTIPKIEDNITRDIKLTGKDFEVQEASIKKYLENRDQLVADYIKENGKIVNVDEARKFFKDVGYTGTNAAAVQEASSALGKDIWRQQLKGEGYDSLIFAGGSGTGKTSIAESLLPKEMANASAILDGNLSSIKSAVARIDESLKAGKYPTIGYVYREPVDAWVNGVIKRMMKNKAEGGRIVPMSVFLQNHAGSYDVIKTLFKDPGLYEKFDIKMLDNSLGKGNQALMSKAKFDSIKYPESLRDTLLKETKKLYEEGAITKEQYEALIK